MRKRLIGISVFLSLVVLMAACSPQAELVPTPTESPVPETPTPTTPVEPTETDQPGRIVLAMLPGADPARVEEIRLVLQEAAEARGLQLVVQENANLESGAEGLEMVVILSGGQEVQSLAQTMPKVQFIAIGAVGVAPTENLTVISTGDRRAKAAFLAGYIAAIESAEYRIGIISVSTPEGQTYREAFINGVIYFCGTCTPVFPPFVLYPVYAEVVENAGVEAVQQVVNELIANNVTMVHVSPEIQTEAIYQYLVQNGIQIVGTDAPPAGLEDNWVASVVLESGMELRDVVDTALNGQSSGEVGEELVVDFTVMSAARIAHLEEIIAMLESGAIDPVGKVD